MARTLWQLLLRNSERSLRALAVDDREGAEAIAHAVRAAQLTKRGAPASALASQGCGRLLKLISTSLHRVVAKLLPASANRLDTVKVDYDRPIGSMPELALELEGARAQAIGDLAGLGQTWPDTAARHGIATGSLDHARIAELVRGKVIDATHAGKLEAAATVFAVADQDYDLAAVLLAVAPGGTGAGSLDDLARVTPDGWRAALVKLPASVAAGYDLARLPQALADRFAALAPTATMATLRPRPTSTQLAPQLDEIGPLLKDLPDALQRDALPAATTVKQVAAHRALRGLALAYPGLGLEQVLADPHATANAKIETTARRIAQIDRLVDQHGIEYLTQLDYSPRSADIAGLELGRVIPDPKDHPPTLAYLKAVQRAYTLTANITDTQVLIDRGFSSARRVAVLDEDRFVMASGLPPQRARATYARARDQLADAVMASTGALEVWRERGAKGSLGNVSPSVHDYLRELPGFAELFGTLSYCKCTACQSILGPAAYFVDLMKFIDEHIRDQLAAHPGHVLDLRTRRPDLWTLLLTCDETDQRLPLLQIVDEVLADYIATERRYPGTDEARRATAHALLANSADTLRRPFDLALTRARLYLTQLGSSHEEVATVLRRTGKAWVRAELAASAVELDRITSASTNLTDLADQAGLPSSVSGLTAVDVAPLLVGTGLTIAELQALTASKLVAGDSTITIQAEKASSDSIQNDIERVRGLTAASLDRLLRMVRLQRKLPWSIAELDRVASALAITELTAATVEQLTRARTLQDQLRVSVDDLAALVGVISALPARTSMFDRIFKPPCVAASDALPTPLVLLVLPAFSTATTPGAEPMAARLSAALGLDAATFEGLVRTLASHLTSLTAALPAVVTPGFDPTASDESRRGFALTSANLWLLYRHARLARALDRSIPDLFRVAKIAGVTGPIGSLDDVRRVVEVAAWQRASGYTLDEIDFLLDPGPVAGAALADAALVGGADALSFEPTLFAAALGMTEVASEELIAINSGVIVPAGTRWRLADGVTLASVAFAIPPSAIIVEPTGQRLVILAEIRDTLHAYQAGEVIARRLATRFGFTPDKIRALARLAGVDLDSPAVGAALLGASTDSLAVLLAPLSRSSKLLQAVVWDAAAIEHVRIAPGRYGITNPVALDLDGLRAISVVTAMMQRPRGVPPADSGIDPANLRAVLDAHAATGFPAAVLPQLAAVLGAPASLIDGVRRHVEVEPIAALALASLVRAVDLAERLGVSGDTLFGLLATDYAARSGAADALVSAMRARHPDAQELAALLEPIEQRLLELSRDALTEYVMRSIHPGDFADLHELSSYFLIDVEAGGCQSTSKLVAATMAAQLYVHRVRMNLEQDRRDPGHPEHVELSLSDDAVEEWEWRKNYRVWEANRKVFLWPENYLEPDLRDDKTELFKELERELLQTDVNEQTVLDAYTKYLRGFDELANLTIAGAYHETAKDAPMPDDSTKPADPITPDVLHLFGVSTADPPTFYYRTCENLLAGGTDSGRTPLWSGWQKVAVQIPTRRVTPFVFEGQLHLFWTGIRTRARTKITSQGSQFAGYLHTMKLSCSSLRLDGTWAPPQDLSLPASGSGFGPGAGVVSDDLTDSRPKYDADRDHPEPIDDYTLSGRNWDTVWIDRDESSSAPRLMVTMRNFLAKLSLDLFNRTAAENASTASAWSLPRILHYTGNELSSYVIGRASWDSNADANLAVDEERLTVARRERDLSERVESLSPSESGWPSRVANSLPAGVSLLALPGNIEDVIIQVGPDVIILQGSVTPDERYIAHRLGTTLSRKLAQRLFTSSVSSFLSIDHQLELAEGPLPFTPEPGAVIDQTNADRLDFQGAYGTYYRELFFHIPFLIANQLNSQGKFEAAQRWYQFIFDPTSNERIVTDANLSPSERAHRLLDRVWRYSEFRDLDVDHVREVLTDREALEKYRRDPFNPHAIARLRPSAYQKAIVMKYVDNLLDWADHLFTQFTMESVNEALMLYLTAFEVLGPRPAELSDCGEGGVRPRDYAHIGPLLDGTDDFLVEAESWVLADKWKAWRPAGSKAKRATGLQSDAMAKASAKYPLPKRRATPTAITSGAAAQPAARSTSNPMRSSWRQSEIAGWTAAGAASESFGAGLAGGADMRARTVGKPPTFKGRGLAPSAGVTRTPGASSRFGWSLMRTIKPVFCFPPNNDLLAYWDRVEDRLFKIRHCMDISGQRRDLALFAPEIDPRLLVRARTAGLDLEDVLSSTGGSLPPYRFLFLIERAKAFAASLQSFGNALTAALEKRDGEELARLRQVHQQNLTSFSTRLREWDVELAEGAVQTLELQKAAAEYRRDYHQQLLDRDRTGNEQAQTVSRHLASAMYMGEAVTQLIAGIVAVIPQIGSPFAMTYGGLQLKGSAGGFAAMAKATAQGSEAIGASAGLEANFERRREGWDLTRELASRDVAVLTRQQNDAELRVKVAQRSLKLHENTLAQGDELLELMDGKFSSLGLYTTMSQQLQRLYRTAYVNALAMAKLAEQAYRFERSDEGAPRMAESYWDLSRAGLMSGEKLMLDLQSLERRFIETNDRTHEINQSFSVSQIAPGELIKLRETGQCTVSIPEFYFDLYYPGHFKRRIRSVRLTMPCITGPFVNVSATLELTSSKIRPEASSTGLLDVPPRRTTTIATSTAQNDAGVFELSFHDERYMPFEGAGAISTWQITLPGRTRPHAPVGEPKIFRPFDYQTITDAVLSISYTAEIDRNRRDQVEVDIARSLLNVTGTSSLPRMFSLRQDFSSSFTRLLRSPIGTEVRFELDDRHFPVFAQGRTLTTTTATLLVRTVAGATLGALAITIDGTPLTDWTRQPSGLPNAALPLSFTDNVRPHDHTLAVSNSGNLALPDNPSSLDDSKLLDVLIYLEYRLT